ncbi:unnamed protein product [Arabis nemorensis]|uniref:Uncharacterized protein n=1 Tax=Arabis nemorensis TaxID=586526 RepID=A0A565AVD8_9BRAS|nr:unnamed protein product [Arabis nemorensis]
MNGGRWIHGQNDDDVRRMDHEQIGDEWSVGCRSKRAKAVARSDRWYDDGDGSMVATQVMMDL